MIGKRSLDLNEAANRFGLAFWLLWLLAGSVGWMVGMSLAWLLSTIIGPLLEGGWVVVLWAVGGLLVGFNFGVNHWFLFRPLDLALLNRRTHAWVIATILGWSLSLAIVIGLGAGGTLGYPMTGLVIGLVVGIPQSLSLNLPLKLAWQWPLAHAAAWMLAMSILLVTDLAVGFALAGVVSAGITGLAFIRLQRRLSGLD